MSNSKSTNVRVTRAEVYYLPVTMRVPLKFGPETVSNVTCLRTAVTVTNEAGESATGWGETPLSVSWVWPSSISNEVRASRMRAFSNRLAAALVNFDLAGHPMEIGHDFIEGPLAGLLADQNVADGGEAMPYLASLVAFSAFDIAIHDAYGRLNGCDIYATYNAEFMNRDLSAYLEADEGSGIDFAGKYPVDFLVERPAVQMPVWHLVGGVDALETADLKGSEPDDGHPILLADWIEKDGLTCLKIKLRGNDAAWDYDRIVRVGRIGFARGVKWLSTDFNCTVKDPAYVCEILDRLLAEEPEIYARTLYVEQPFPHDLEEHQIDVRAVSARKPLFLDESAHDWKFVRMGRSLGWSGVALKTCKTQTGALLSLCWAKGHGMPLMVQDLTNPMLAMLPHVRLAAHAGTIQGVECNAMQFYPAASEQEQRVHPGIFARRGGILDLSTLGGPGFGYREEEIGRELGEAAVVVVERQTV